MTKPDDCNEKAAGGRFYVYVLFRPNGLPVYVGKGKGDRWLFHEKDACVGKYKNFHLTAIIKNAGGSLPKVKIRENMTEDEAFILEIALINVIGREIDGGPLVNLVLGGEGTAGLVMSNEHKAKIRSAHTGKLRSPEWCAAISASKKGMKMTDAHRSALSKAAKQRVDRISHHARLKLINLGSTPANKGRKMDPDFCKKIQQKSLESWAKVKDRTERMAHLNGPNGYRARSKCALPIVP